MTKEELQVPGYDIEERIGRGGMASVYRARQHTFDRDVALKVLKSDLSEDESFCQRFVQESLIVAKLHHSNIVQVYDVGEFQNNFYIAMEYLNGGDLNAALKKGIPVKHTVKIIKQAASALDFAHRKGIIHRDIKPDNIMFREDGAAVLTDFGIAKEIHSDLDLTQTGLIVGTPKYMAPEQIRGASPSAQADIYSLGILLFQCLTDEVPFHGKDMVSTAYKHFNDPVPQLPPLVAVFQPIVEKMLAKEPEDRYQRANEIVEALDELTGDSQTSLTNLDITKDFVAPASNLDPTIVHPHNQDTEETSAVDAPASAADETVLTHAGTASESSSTAEEIQEAAEEATEKSRTWLWPIAAVAVIVVAVLLGNMFLSGIAPDNKIEQAPLASADTQDPQIESVNQNTTAPDPGESKPTLNNLANNAITIERLLKEAQTDIAEKRLKKPDSNNAFTKLQRVLAVDPENVRALAAMEQIAEEYVKLAESALSNRHYIIAESYLNHARSASEELGVIETIQNTLDNAIQKQSKNLASIESMQKSLMIEGLLESAAIDEKDGRLISPQGAVVF